MLSPSFNIATYMNMNGFMLRSMVPAPNIYMRQGHMPREGCIARSANCLGLSEASQSCTQREEPKTSLAMPYCCVCLQRWTRFKSSIFLERPALGVQLESMDGRRNINVPTSREDAATVTGEYISHTPLINVRLRGHEC